MLTDKKANGIKWATIWENGDNKLIGHIDELEANLKLYIKFRNELERRNFGNNCYSMIRASILPIPYNSKKNDFANYYCNKTNIHIFTNLQDFHPSKEIFSDDNILGLSYKFGDHFHFANLYVKLVKVLTKYPDDSHQFNNIEELTNRLLFENIKV